MGLIMVRLALIVTLALCARTASAHEQWANGTPVPAWVKAACCGPTDVHHLKPEQVHEMPDGYHVEGYPHVIPYGKATPSQDAEFWAFYQTNVNGPYVSYSPIYCFFAPPRSF